MPKPGPRKREFTLHTEFITLGQLLKAMDYVGSGAEVKDLLADGGFTVNGEPDNRRGRKLRPGDTVVLFDGTTVSILGGQAASP